MADWGQAVSAMSEERTLDFLTLQGNLACKEADLAWLV